MDQILAMVKTVGNPSAPVQRNSNSTSFESTATGCGELKAEVKTEVQDPILSQVFPHLSTSSESTSEDHSMSFDYLDAETSDGRTHQLPFRQFIGDPREKKLQEKIEFVKIVYKHKSSLFGDCDGHEITPRSKEDAWKRVAGEVELANLESYRGKPWARLRDHDWQYVRRHALSRNENTTRPCGKLGELDKIVLEIISTTALVNAASLMSQGSTNSQTSQQSTDSEYYFLKAIMGSVNQESADTPEIATSFDAKDDTVPTVSIPKADEIVVNTSITVPTVLPPVTAAENILGYLQKVTHVSPSLSVDAALQSASRALTKSPICAKKITSRSATAPSVYAITSSTASPPQIATTSSIHPPLTKRARVESEKSPGASSVCSTFEQKKEALMLRKMEVDIRHTELLNEKLEIEIRAIEAQEKRSMELHTIEVRAAKARMLRGSAIDEPSIDTNQRVLVRQPNGYNME